MQPFRCCFRPLQIVFPSLENCALRKLLECRHLSSSSIRGYSRERTDIPVPKGTPALVGRLTGRRRANRPTDQPIHQWKGHCSRFAGTKNERLIAR